MAKRVHNRELIAKLLEIVATASVDLTPDQQTVVEKAKKLLEG